MAFLNSSPPASLPLRALLLNGTPSASLPLRALLLFVILAGFAHEAAADTYRYTNDRGQTVVGTTVPPQFVKNGYEVMNDRGQVIRVVARAATQAELAAQAADRERLEAEEAATREQLNADNLLLRLYRSPDEIARKRDERLTLIESQIIAMAASLSKAQEETTRLQGVVDNYIKGGTEVPATTQESLRVQQSELERLTTQQTRLETDRATAVADADRDMKRLAELLGLPEDTETE